MRYLFLFLSVLFCPKGGSLYASNLHSCEDLPVPQMGENSLQYSEKTYRYTASAYELVRITSVGFTEKDTKVRYSLECPIHNDSPDLKFKTNDDIVDGVLQSAAQVELQPGQTIYITWVAKNSSSGFTWSFEASPPETGQLCTIPETAFIGENFADQDYWGQWFLYTTSKSGVYKISSEAFQQEYVRLVVYLNGCPSTTFTEAGSSSGQVIDSDFSFELPGGQSIFFRWLSYDIDGLDWNFSFIPCPRRYLDSDGDRYGNPNVFIESCSEVEGYVSNSDDCNDSDASINPELVWYEDSDNDGKGSFDSIIESCQQPQNYVANSDDCNDDDPNIAFEKDWFKDEDGDGFGSPLSVMVSCEMPEGYVANSSDCNDENSEINPETIWFEDKDGDGFGSKSITRSCEQPEGYVFNSNDCDDADAELTSERIWYADADKDGFGNSNFSQRSCSPPLGFVGVGGDCNDNDADVYPGAPNLPDGKDNDCDGVVDKLSQVIAFESVSDLVDDGTIVELKGSSDSGLPITYEIEGPIQFVSRTSITGNGAGKATIIALQNGDNNYLPAEPVSISLCVIPSPKISLIQDFENNIVLSSNYDSGNQWFKNGELLEGEDNKIYEVSSVGSYSITVDIDGCKGESETYDIILTRIDDETFASVKIYPNPVEDIFNLKMVGSSLKSEILLSVYDANGKLRISKSLTDIKDEILSIDVSELDRGVYFLNLQSDKIFVKEKFVKE